LASRAGAATDSFHFYGNLLRSNTGRKLEGFSAGRLISGGIKTSSKSTSICHHCHTGQVNGGKITISYGVPLFDALIKGESPLTVAQNFVAKKLDTQH